MQPPPQVGREGRGSPPLPPPRDPIRKPCNSVFTFFLRAKWNGCHWTFVCEWEWASAAELTLWGPIAQLDGSRGDSTLKASDGSHYISWRPPQRWLHPPSLTLLFLKQLIQLDLLQTDPKRRDLRGVWWPNKVSHHWSDVLFISLYGLPAQTAARHGASSLRQPFFSFICSASVEHDSPNFLLLIACVLIKIPRAILLKASVTLDGKIAAAATSGPLDSNDQQMEDIKTKEEEKRGRDLQPKTLWLHFGVSVLSNLKSLSSNKIWLECK